MCIFLAVLCFYTGAKNFTRKIASKGDRKQEQNLHLNIHEENHIICVTLLKDCCRNVGLKIPGDYGNNEEAL